MYKSYDASAMAMAIDTVRARSMTTYAAADAFKVPKSTLKDYIQKNYLPGGPQGPDPFLTAKEEENLVLYIKWMSTHGWGLTRKMVIGIKNLMHNIHQ